MKKRRFLAPVLILLVLLCGALLLSGCKKDPEDADSTKTPLCSKHTFAEDGWTYLSGSTCTETGLRRATCTVCGKVVDEVIPKKGHIAGGDWREVKPATCTADGTKERKCTVCGEQAETTIIDQIAHTFGEWTVTREPTCTLYGIRERTCTVCGQPDISDELHIPETGHPNATEIIDLAPTCGAPGIKHVFCPDCETNVQENVPIPETSHADLEWVTDAEPSCALPAASMKSAETVKLSYRQT
jgi:hypothetical protein